MRGEDSNSGLSASASRGSPPHARGRLARGSPREGYRGITPACAGKTSTPTTQKKRNPDHPRMRGEDFSYKKCAPLSEGSPPHARGRRQLAHLVEFADGITPACAGKTTTETKSAMQESDHPRMRGEDHPKRGTILSVTGSPPHARGRPWVQCRRPNRLGITPACAGKTERCRCGDGHIEDHPRMRGEDTWERKLSSGTSWITPACAGKTGRRKIHAERYRDHPRMRGEDLKEVVDVRRTGGITPACAGKTNTLIWRMRSSKDHPRMRGEDWDGRGREWELWGSPPHARGRHVPRATRRARRRITPACAGKTPKLQCQEPYTPDHPRMRGEDASSPFGGDCKEGSPPHARGRHVPRATRRPRRRITPACAGKTPCCTVGMRPSRDHPRMRGEDGKKEGRVYVADGSPPHARGRPLCQ